MHVGKYFIYACVVILICLLAGTIVLAAEPPLKEDACAACHKDGTQLPCCNKRDQERRCIKQAWHLPPHNVLNRRGTALVRHRAEFGQTHPLSEVLHHQMGVAAGAGRRVAESLVALCFCPSNELRQVLGRRGWMDAKYVLRLQYQSDRCERSGIWRRGRKGVGIDG